MIDESNNCQNINNAATTQERIADGDNNDGNDDYEQNQEEDSETEVTYLLNLVPNDVNNINQKLEGDRYSKKCQCMHFGLYKDNSLLSDEHEHLCKILDWIIWLDIMWYVIYISILVIQRLMLTLQMRSKLNVNLDDHDHNGYPSLFFDGYIESFTMGLHRAFILSIIHKLLYDNKCMDMVSIYMALSITSLNLILNSTYIVKILLHIGLTNDPLSIELVTSLVMICYELSLFVAMSCTIYQLAKLRSQDSEGTKRPTPSIDVQRKNRIVRPTIRDIAMISIGKWEQLLNSGVISNTRRTSVRRIKYNKNVARLITFCIFSLICIICVEIMLTMFIDTIMFEKFNWDLFNEIILYAYHLSVMSFYAYLLSIYKISIFNNIFALMFLIYVGCNTHLHLAIKYSKMILIVLFIIGVNSYKFVDIDDYLTYFNYCSRFRIQSRSMYAISRGDGNSSSSRLRSNIDRNSLKNSNIRLITLFLCSLVGYIVFNILLSDSMNAVIVKDVMDSNYNDVMINWYCLGNDIPMIDTAFHSGFY